MRTTYEDVKPGEWEEYGWSHQLIRCCDCSLTHVYDFRVRKGQLEARVVRDNRATGQLRRHGKITIKKGK